MSLRKNGFFTPRLLPLGFSIGVLRTFEKPGEQKRSKTKGLQPLKGLNATKNDEKITTGLNRLCENEILLHRGFSPVY